MSEDMENPPARRMVSLWEDLLKRALHDYRYGPTEQELKDYIFCTREDAEQWLFSDSIAPGSFHWVCDMLGLEPSAVRREAKQPDKTPSQSHKR